MSNKKKGKKLMQAIAKYKLFTLEADELITEGKIYYTYYKAQGNCEVVEDEEYFAAEANECDEEIVDVAANDNGFTVIYKTTYAIINF